MTATEKTEMALSLSKDIINMEIALVEKRAALAKLFEAENVVSMVFADDDARANAPAPEIPVSIRLRSLLEMEPGKRFHLDEIRQRLGDPAPTALRKALYRLTHESKNFARDKRGRGLYYCRG